MSSVRHVLPGSRLIGAAIGLASLAGSGRAHPEPTELGDFTGTYVLIQQTVTVTEIPILADVVATTRAVSLQRLEQSGDRLHGQGPLCSLDMQSSSGLVATELPSALRRSLPPIVTDAQLVRDRGSLRFQQAAQTNVVGARLQNTKSDPLPDDARDPRVFDQDRDGKPGVTVRVSGIVSGEIYVAQRGTSSLRGRWKNGIFTGSIAFVNEQRILGATSRHLEDPPVAKPDPSRSRFWLVPVKPGTSCSEAAIVARKWH